MFEPVPIPLKAAPTALLQSMTYRDGSFSVVVEQERKAVQIRFNNVVGLTFFDDLFGTDGGQVLQDDCNQRAPLSVSDTSRTMQKVRSVPEPFDDVFTDLRHYRLNLREHTISLVADKNIEILKDGPAA